MELKKVLRVHSLNWNRIKQNSNFHRLFVIPRKNRATQLWNLPW